MVFRKLSLKASALVLILLLGMVFLAGCGAKETATPSQPEKTIEDTKQPLKDQASAPEPPKEAPAQEPAQVPTEAPAQSSQSTQENSSSAIPNVPHPAEATTDCLSCHQEGINGAPKAPHPQRQQCVSCHRLANQ